MTTYIAIVLSILLVCGPAGADDPPAATTEPPASTDAAPESSTDGPTNTRPDFAAVKKSLVVVKDAENDRKQAPGFAISDQGHIVTYAGPLGNKPSYLVSNAEDQIFSADRLTTDEKNQPDDSQAVR